MTLQDYFAKTTMLSVKFFLVQRYVYCHGSQKDPPTEKVLLPTRCHISFTEDHIRLYMFFLIYGMYHNLSHIVTPIQ